MHNILRDLDVFTLFTTFSVTARCHQTHGTPSIIDLAFYHAHLILFLVTLSLPRVYVWEFL